MFVKFFLSLKKKMEISNFSELSILVPRGSGFFRTGSIKRAAVFPVFHFLQCSTCISPTKLFKASFFLSSNLPIDIAVIFLTQIRRENMNVVKGISKETSTFVQKHTIKRP